MKSPAPSRWAFSAPLMPTAAMRSSAGIPISSRTAWKRIPLVMYEILKAGGFTTGGLNFDAKVRRQSTDKYDMFYGHIGAMDVMALSLKLAARMIEDGKLDQGLTKRYAGWQGELGQKIMSGQMSLDNIARYAEQHNLNPQPQSGRQELLENLVNTYIFG